MRSNNDFPDLNKHQPDCVSITDEELSSTIESHWPVKNGVSVIHYSFSVTPFWASLVLPIRLNRFLPERRDDEFKETMEEVIRFDLDKWTNASNGALQFIEDKQSNPFSPGIFIYLGGSEEYLGGAFTLRKIGFNGEISQAFIFYPDNGAFWDIDGGGDEWRMNAHVHEQGHGLGFNHLHDYASIKAILERTPDGVYCSVMTYPEQIQTNISSCLVNCNPSYAVYPASLDSRMVGLSVNGLAMNYFTREKCLGYLLSAVDAIMPSLLTTLSHNITSTFIANLAFKKDKPIFSEKTAYFIADAGLTAALISLEFPIWVASTFAATSMTKFIPQKYLEKLPSKLKCVLESNYNFYTLSACTAYIQNTNVILFLITTGLSVLGCLKRTTKSCLAKPLYWIANLIPQAITSYCCKSDESKNEEIMLNDISVSEVNSEQKSTVEFNVLDDSKFVTPSYERRPSCGERFWAFFGCGKKTAEVVQEDIPIVHRQFRTT